MRSMRMDSALVARQRSSARPVTRLYLMPASGRNSKVVTTGPGLIWTTWPRTSNSAHFSTSAWAEARRSSSRTGEGSSLRWSRVLGGRRNPDTFLGATVTVRCSVSARSPMEGPARSVTTRNQLRARRRGRALLAARWQPCAASDPTCRWSSIRGSGSFGKAVLAMGNVVVLHSSDGDRRVRAVAGFHGFFSNFAGLLQILFVDTCRAAQRL